MFGLGIWELIVIAIVALLALGPERLPGAAKALGKGIRDLRKQTRDLQHSLEHDTQIGDAVKDLKAALRGEDPPPRRPPPVQGTQHAAAAPPMTSGAEADPAPGQLPTPAQGPSTAESTQQSNTPAPWTAAPAKSTAGPDGAANARPPTGPTEYGETEADEKPAANEPPDTAHG